MTMLMPDPDQVQRAAVATTRVPNLSTVPLNQLADTVELLLSRIVPQAGGEKPSRAAFDASL